MPRRRVLVALVLIALCGATCRRRPRFSLLVLGAYGGGRDGNLTSFALRLTDREGYRVLLDAGSLAPGISAHRGSPEFQGVKDFFLGIEELLLTHAHLDHVTGFVTLSPALFEREGRLGLRAHPATLQALREHMFRSDLWIDLEAYEQVEMIPQTLEERAEVDGMGVRLLPLEHPVPSYGFLFESPDGEAFVHIGDTGPTRAYHPPVRNLLRSGRLRALSIECSFRNERLELAKLSGHLTPDLVLRQLVALATGENVPPGTAVPEELLSRTGKAFRGVLVLLQHLKPDDEEAIRSQLGPLRNLGLDLRVARQGLELQF